MAKIKNERNYLTTKLLINYRKMEFVFFYRFCFLLNQFPRLNKIISLTIKICIKVLKFYLKSMDYLIYQLKDFENC